MKFITLVAAIFMFGAMPATAGHHEGTEPGPERGQGLSGQGAESSGGKSTEAITKDKGQDSDSDSGDSDSDKAQKEKKEKKAKKAKKDKSNKGKKKDK